MEAKEDVKSQAKKSLPVSDKDSSPDAIVDLKDVVILKEDGTEDIQQETLQDSELNINTDIETQTKEDDFPPDEEFINGKVSGGSVNEITTGECAVNVEGAVVTVGDAVTVDGAVTVDDAITVDDAVKVDDAVVVNGTLTEEKSSHVKNTPSSQTQSSSNDEQNNSIVNNEDDGISEEISTAERDVVQMGAGAIPGVGLPAEIENEELSEGYISQEAEKSPEAEERLVIRETVESGDSVQPSENLPTLENGTSLENRKSSEGGVSAVDDTVSSAESNGVSQLLPDRDAQIDSGDVSVSKEACNNINLDMQITTPDNVYNYGSQGGNITSNDQTDRKLEHHSNIPHTTSHNQTDHSDLTDNTQLLVNSGSLLTETRGEVQIKSQYEQTEAENIITPETNTSELLESSEEYANEIHSLHEGSSIVEYPETIPSTGIEFKENKDISEEFDTLVDKGNSPHISDKLHQPVTDVNYVMNVNSTPELTGTSPSDITAGVICVEPAKEVVCVTQKESAGVIYIEGDTQGTSSTMDDIEAVKDENNAGFESAPSLANNLPQLSPECDSKNSSKEANQGLEINNLVNEGDQIAQACPDSQIVSSEKSVLWEEDSFKVKEFVEGVISQAVEVVVDSQEAGVDGVQNNDTEVGKAENDLQSDDVIYSENKSAEIFIVDGGVNDLKGAKNVQSGFSVEVEKESEIVQSDISVSKVVVLDAEDTNQLEDKGDLGETKFEPSGQTDSESDTMSETLSANGDSRAKKGRARRWTIQEGPSGIDALTKPSLFYDDSQVKSDLPFAKFKPIRFNPKDTSSKARKKRVSLGAPIGWGAHSSLSEIDDIPEIETLPVVSPIAIGVVDTPVKTEESVEPLRDCNEQSHPQEDVLENSKQEPSTETFINSPKQVELLNQQPTYFNYVQLSPDIKTNSSEQSLVGVTDAAPAEPQSPVSPSKRTTKISLEPVLQPPAKYYNVSPSPTTPDSMRENYASYRSVSFAEGSGVVTEKPSLTAEEERRAVMDALKVKRPAKKKWAGQVESEEKEKIKEVSLFGSEAESYKKYQQRKVERMQRAKSLDSSGNLSVFRGTSVGWSGRDEVLHDRTSSCSSSKDSVSSQEELIKSHDVVLEHQLNFVKDSSTDSKNSLQGSLSSENGCSPLTIDIVDSSVGQRDVDGSLSRGSSISREDMLSPNGDCSSSGYTSGRSTPASEDASRILSLPKSPLMSSPDTAGVPFGSYKEYQRLLKGKRTPSEEGDDARKGGQILLETKVTSPRVTSPVTDYPDDTPNVIIVDKNGKPETKTEEMPPPASTVKNVVKLRNKMDEKKTGVNSRVVKQHRKSFIEIELEQQKEKEEAFRKEQEMREQERLAGPTTPTTKVFGGPTSPREPEAKPPPVKTASRSFGGTKARAVYEELQYKPTSGGTRSTSMVKEWENKFK